MDDLEFIEDLALMELDKLNPTLSGQPLTEKAKNYFLHEIRSRRWELGRGRQVTPLTETGAIVSDAHGWPIPFSDVIRDIASELFDNVPAKESAPEKMTEQEYVSSMAKAETPEQRIALMKVWQAQQQRK